MTKRATIVSMVCLILLGSGASIGQLNTFGQNKGAASIEQEAPVILEITVNNRAFYVHDQPDYSKLATNPNPTAPIVVGRTFSDVTGIGDIVTLNGKPARGTYVTRFNVLNLSPTPPSGKAVGDVTRSQISDSVYEIQDADGNPLGTLMLTGLVSGTPPPGSPDEIVSGNFVITGGTGVFLGARGQGGERPPGVFGRPASVTEDPSLRRVHGGGSATVVLALIHDSCPYASTISVKFDPATVRVGGSFTATISGANLFPGTYFDIRFRPPGSSTDDVATDWQQGTSEPHTVPAGVATGTWSVTGIRVHSDLANHSGPFIPASATLAVTP